MVLIAILCGLIFLGSVGTVAWDSTLKITILADKSGDATSWIAAWVLPELLGMPLFKSGVVPTQKQNNS